MYPGEENKCLAGAYRSAGVATARAAALTPNVMQHILPLLFYAVPNSTYHVTPNMKYFIKLHKSRNTFIKRLRM